MGLDTRPRRCVIAVPRFTFHIMLDTLFLTLRLFFQRMPRSTLLVDLRSVH